MGSGFHWRVEKLVEKLTCGHDARLTIDGMPLKEWVEKYHPEEIEAISNKVSEALKRQLSGKNAAGSIKRRRRRNL